MLGENALSDTEHFAASCYRVAEHVLGSDRVDEVAGDLRGRLEASMRETLEENGAEGRLHDVDRVDSLDPETFFDEYVAEAEPVVVEDAVADCDAARDWSMDYFAQAYADEPITLVNMSREVLGDESIDAQSYQVPLREALEEMRDDPDVYLRFSPLLEQCPELLHDLPLEWLRSRRPPGSNNEMFRLFIGGGGSNTGFHAAIGCNIFTQLQGPKHWLLYPPSFNPAYGIEDEGSPAFYSQLDPADPDYDEYPLFEYADGYEVTIEGGDALYVPPFYFHQVENRGESIGVGYRFYHTPSIVRSSVTQMLLTFMAYNPPAWRMGKHDVHFNDIWDEIDR